jgi:hypothetical protein
MACWTVDMRLILCFSSPSPYRPAPIHFFAIAGLRCITPQLRFFHKDCEIACDNTLTYRACYQDDEAKAGVSVLLTRLAGRNRSPRIRLQLADTGSPVPDSVQMHVAGRKPGAVRIDGNAEGELSANQCAALLAAVLKDATISWTAKRKAGRSRPSWRKRSC